MGVCRHRVRPSLEEIFTLQPTFYCEACESEVELVRPWRILRNVFNAAAILVLLYAAFAQLEGTLSSLWLMLAAIAADVLLFFLVNYLMLTRLPMEKARRELDPAYFDEGYGAAAESELEEDVDWAERKRLRRALEEERGRSVAEQDEPRE